MGEGQGEGCGKRGGRLLKDEREKILNAVLEICGRGNTAEVKKTRAGLIVLEVKRKIIERK